ncbi:hypothetical protein JCM15519_06220 [Fundidesulfovibrio butyratiphilus]
MSARAGAIPWLRVIRSLAAGHAPGQAVIQLSDACNATCLHCAMSAKNRFVRTTLRVDAVKELLDRLAARGVMAVSFTGGEPLLRPNLVAACAAHARSLGMASVRTGSNGFFLRGSDRPGFADKVGCLADLLLENGLTSFWLSLDSADTAFHERHRGLSGVVRGMAEGLPVFARHGLHPAANLCINRRMGGRDVDTRGMTPDALREHYYKDFVLYFAHVLELGFCSVNICHPMTPQVCEPGQTVYQAASQAAFITFRPEEQVPLYRALFDAVTDFRKRLQIFTPRSTLLSMIRHRLGVGFAGYGCRGGMDFFFVDSAGMDAFPCGYRGGEKLTELLTAAPRADTGLEPCARCDWECFRDPSHLFGPLLELFANPLTLARRFVRDPKWGRLWLGDVLYLRSCHWFDARRTPRYGPRPT